MKHLFTTTKTRGSKRLGRSLGVSLTATLLAFSAHVPIAQGATVPDEPSSRPGSMMASPPDAEINRSLANLALKLAETLGDDPNLRGSIQSAVGKRFDGDTEALWSTLEETSKINDRIADGASEREAIASETDLLPRLQISVPVHFEEWDPLNYTPMVAYFPEGVDDTTLKSITAYSSDGTATQLDAQDDPRSPVIVLSLNERTDDVGNLKPQVESTFKLEAQETTSVASAAAPAKYSVDMMIVELKDDKEPWAKGNAEISMKARSKGCSGTNYLDTNWDNLDDTGDAWGPAGGRNIGTTTCDVVFYWWEDDGGSFDFTLTYGGLGLGVQMDDSDDLIGGKQLPHGSFQGSSLREDVWSALEQWTV